MKIRRLCKDRCLRRGRGESLLLAAVSEVELKMLECRVW